MASMYPWPLLLFKTLSPLCAFILVEAIPSSTTIVLLILWYSKITQSQLVDIYIHHVLIKYIKVTMFQRFNYFSGFFFDILPFLSLPILSRTTMAIKQLECFSCVIVATNWFWTLQYYYLKLLFLQIRFYFHVNQLKIVNCKDWNLIKLYIPYLFVANRNLLLNKG